MELMKDMIGMSSSEDPKKDVMEGMNFHYSSLE